MIDQNSNPTQLINNFKGKLRYAFDIVQAASGHASFATNQGFDEPAESYRYTQQLLGRDTQIMDDVDVQAYYQGRGTRSLELSAALEIARGIFAQQIVEVLKEPNQEKLIGLKHEFGLHHVFANDDHHLKSAAEQTITVSDEVAAFLADVQNREQMRVRFPDAGLSDEIIHRVMRAPA